VDDFAKAYGLSDEYGRLPEAEMRERGSLAEDFPLQFGSGGIFYGKRGGAHWTLRGKTVTVTGTTPNSADLFSQTLAIDRTGDDTMTMEGRRYHRCSN